MKSEHLDVVRVRTGMHHSYRTGIHSFKLIVGEDRIEQQNG